MNAQGPKVLMISSDRLIGAPGSAVSERMGEYGSLVGELHILLLCDLKHSLKPSQLSPNVWVHPTNSISKFLRPFDAVKIGKKLSPDLITAQDPFECGWAGLKLKRIHRAPLEIQLHTDPFSPHFVGILNTVRKMIAKHVMPRADGVRVVTQSVADDMVEKFALDKGKVSILPIYIERKRISGEPQFDLHERYGLPRVALAVSRLSSEKNLGLAIEAVSKLDGVGLVIVGAGPDEGRLRKLSDRLGAKTAFADWQEDLSSFYKTADVFVQTSHYEGYGLSLLEAGLCSLPAVTTDVGVASEFENGREIIIAEPNAEAFAKALAEVLESDVRRKDLGINFCRAVEAHIDTKEAYLTKLKESWLKLLKTKS